METTTTSRSRVSYSDGNGESDYPQSPKMGAGSSTTGESAANEVSELIGKGPSPRAKETTPGEPPIEAGVMDDKHARVSSPAIRETDSESTSEESSDTESAYEEGWEEKPRADTEAGEEAEPTIEASYVAAPSADDKEFFGFLAAALPAILPIIKPLVSQAVPAAVKAATSLISPAIKKLPTSVQPTAKSLLDQLTKLGLKVKLESAGDEAGGENGDEAVEVDTEAAVAAQQQIEALETVLGVDDRLRVTNTAITPYKRICHLKITAANGKSYLGSGFFIGPRTILTAGHCVYMHSEGGWPKKIVVTPGRDADSAPFGSFTATKFRSVQGWVRDQDRNYDYGVIQLEKSDAVNPNIGAFGFGYYSDETLLNKKLNNAGYPGDKPAGTMWKNGRRTLSVTSRTIVYEIDTYGGQSGSPVWFYRVSDGRRIVVGIHTNGGSTSNSATRITQDVYNNLVIWRTEGGATY